MKNLQELQNVSSDIRRALLTLLTDVSQRGLEPVDHDGFKEAASVKASYHWLLSLPCRDSQGRVEIRVRERNELLDELDGGLEAAIYDGNTELMCFSLETQSDGVIMWTFRTEEKDPRVQQLLKHARSLRRGCRDIYDPCGESVHKAIWSVLDPILSATN